VGRSLERSAGPARGRRGRDGRPDPPALDGLLAAWDGEGPTGVHVELQDRSTATWLALSLARDHPDRNIEVCCYDEGLARQAIADMIATIGDGDPPAMAIVGDGRLVPLLAIEATDALTRLKRSRAGEVLPTLAIIEHPDGPAIQGRLDRFDGQMAIEVAEQRATMAEPDRARLVVVTYLDQAKSIRVAAEIAARESTSKVFLPERRSFSALGLHSLDPDAAHGSGALDGPFTRAARALGTDREWPPWDDWTSEECRAVATWFRRAVTTLLEPEGFAGTAWTIEQRSQAHAPSPLSFAVGRALISRVGAPVRSDATGIHVVTPEPDTPAHAEAEASVHNLPRHLFEAADLVVRKRKAS
jgi:hypothetical protein